MINDSCANFEGMLGKATPAILNGYLMFGWAHKSHMKLTLATIFPAKNGALMQSPSNFVR